MDVGIARKGTTIQTRAAEAWDIYEYTPTYLSDPYRNLCLGVLCRACYDILRYKMLIEYQQQTQKYIRDALIKEVRNNSLSALRWLNTDIYVDSPFSLSWVCEAIYDPNSNTYVKVIRKKMNDVDKYGLVGCEEFISILKERAGVSLSSGKL